MWMNFIEDLIDGIRFLPPLVLFLFVVLGNELAGRL